MLTDRLFFELGLLARLKGEEPSIKNLSICMSNPLTLRIDLLIQGYEYEFEIIYPRYFPFQPIVIKALTQFQTSHIYRDNSMCLKWGNDNWHEEITGTQMVENLIDLLNVENPLGDSHGIAESGHQFSVGQQVLRNGGTLFLDKEMEKQFKRERGIGQFYARPIGRRSDFNYVYFLKSIGRGKRYFVPDSKGAFQSVRFEYIRSNQTYDEYLQLPKEEQAFAVKEDCFMVFFKDRVLVTRRHKPATDMQEHFVRNIRRLYPEQTTSLGDKDILDRFFILSRIAVKYLEEERQNRILISKQTLTKKITIFGLGSVGSRVLVDLARAGFNNFHIIDDDLFLPPNIARHELSLENIGQYKAEGLSEYIYHLINRDVNITPHNIAVNGQNSSTTIDRFFADISDSDIIVDCTADSNLIFTINAFIMENDLPYISGTVLSGGIGNVLIKRNVGSPLSVIDILETQKKYMRLNGLDRLTDTDYAGTYGSREYIATMSDVSIIAGLVGKAVVNMLNPNERDPLDQDIYVFSTCDGFLGGFYNCQPISAHERNYTPMKLDPIVVRIGKEYYESHNPEKGSSDSIPTDTETLPL